MWISDHRLLGHRRLGQLERRQGHWSAQASVGAAIETTESVTRAVSVPDSGRPAGGDGLAAVSGWLLRHWWARGRLPLGLGPVLGLPKATAGSVAKEDEEQAHPGMSKHTYIQHVQVQAHTCFLSACT